MSPVICDKRMTRKLKIKCTSMYKTMVRPILLYGAECWTVRKKENMLEKMEMRIFRRITAVTLQDRLRSENIRNQLDIPKITKKVRYVRPDCAGLVM